MMQNMTSSTKMLQNLASKPLSILSGAHHLVTTPSSNKIHYSAMSIQNKVQHM